MLPEQDHNELLDQMMMKVDAPCDWKAPRRTDANPVEHTVVMNCPAKGFSAKVDGVLCFGKECYHLPQEKLGVEYVFDLTTPLLNMSCICFSDSVLSVGSTGVARSGFVPYSPNFPNEMGIMTRDRKLLTMVDLIREIIHPNFHHKALTDALCGQYTADDCDSLSLCRRFGGCLSFAAEDQVVFASLMEYVLMKKEIPGDVMEVGCWRGGMTLMMSKILEFFGQTGKRKVFAFDSFQGHPELEGEMSKFSGSKCKFLHASYSEFIRMLQAYNVGNVVALPGWVNETIPNLLETGPREISVLFIDVDSYEPIKMTLEMLYPLVSSGGLIVIDDMNYYADARRAVYDFMFEFQIEAPLLSQFHDDRVMWFKQ